MRFRAVKHCVLTTFSTFQVRLLALLDSVNFPADSHVFGIQAMSIVAETRPRINLEEIVSAGHYRVPRNIQYIYICDVLGERLFSLQTEPREGLPPQCAIWLGVTEVPLLPRLPRDSVNRWTGQTVFEHLAELQGELS